MLVHVAVVGCGIHDVSTFSKPVFELRHGVEDQTPDKTVNLARLTGESEPSVPY